MNKKIHTPVLLQEVLRSFEVKEGEKYIDATVGCGGHSFEILKRGGKVLGIDWDRETINKLRVESQKLKDREGYLKIVQGNFAELGKIAKRENFRKVSGILFDLGLSSWQIEKSGRGFSYQRSEFLDMRLDKTRKFTAADLLNRLSQQELYEIISKFAEEQHSGRIAQAVFSARPITTTTHLRCLIEKAGGWSSDLKIKSVARVFQALRILVNDELSNLRKALPQAIELLQHDGKLGIISFHSLEDRIVKQFFKKCLEDGIARSITRKAIRPTRDEIKRNRRAKSAKLRVLEKL